MKRLQTLRDNWRVILPGSAILLGIWGGLAILDAWINEIPPEWWLRYTLALLAGGALAGLALFPLRRYRRLMVYVGVLLWFLAPFFSGTLQGRYLRTHPDAPRNTPYFLTVSKVANGFCIITMILVCGVPLEVYLSRKTEGWLQRKRDEDPSFRPVQ